jgi:hypothetical protein
MTETTGIGRYTLRQPKRINPLLLPEEIQKQIWNGKNDFEYVWFVGADEPEMCFLLLTHTDDPTLSITLTENGTYISNDGCIIHPTQEVIVGILADML